jgi:hypothetical protein
MGTSIEIYIRRLSPQNLRLLTQRAGLTAKWGGTAFILRVIAARRSRKNRNRGFEPIAQDCLLFSCEIALHMSTALRRPDDHLHLFLTN